MQPLGRRTVWIPSAIVFVSVASLFFASAAPFAIPTVESACGRPPPDMRFFTSADDLTDFLHACGPDGRDAYRNMQLVDLFYPAIVGLFLASSLAAVIGRLTSPSRVSRLVGLAVVPLVAGVFDYAENLFAWIALTGHPEPMPTDVLLGYASAAKTATSWFGGVLLLAALLVLGVRSLRRRIRPVGDGSGGGRLIGGRPLSA